MLTATDSTLETFVVVTPGVQVRGIMQQVLWNLQGSPKHVERRRGQRHAYPYPVRMWPANSCRISKDDAIGTNGDGTIVMGKHLSAGGLDFYSREPIADRRVVISLDYGDSQPFYVLTELTWCRFGGHGMYINGGRFLRALNAAEQISGCSGQ